MQKCGKNMKKDFFRILVEKRQIKSKKYADDFTRIGKAFTR